MALINIKPKTKANTSNGLANNVLAIFRNCCLRVSDLNLGRWAGPTTANDLIPRRTTCATKQVDRSRERSCASLIWTISVANVGSVGLVTPSLGLNIGAALVGTCHPSFRVNACHGLAEREIAICSNSRRGRARSIRHSNFR